MRLHATHTADLCELITLTVPGVALFSYRDIVAAPVLNIRADASSASLNGSLFIEPGEAALQTGEARSGGNLTIQATLLHDTWAAWTVDSVAPLVVPPAMQDAIINGFSGVRESGQPAEANGWNSEPLSIAFEFMPRSPPAVASTLCTKHGPASVVGPSQR